MFRLSTSDSAVSGSASGDGLTNFAASLAKARMGRDLLVLADEPNGTFLTDTVEKVRVAATYGICVEWRSEKTPKVNPDSMQCATVERDSIIGGDFAVRRTFSTISYPITTF
ncbi:hypothetical protein NKI01_07475 [Mesorhizobium sp. M0815]|uniref:hypothetical protein n=1 Tax=Mesorhizobium sp. M0815 TaxID=2957005 RepID=UPI003338D0F7